jgi:pyridoxine/pyridoxamine 5'-phosphate oxidase
MNTFDQQTLPPPLNEKDFDSDPFVMFAEWFDIAQKVIPIEANAITLVFLFFFHNCSIFLPFSNLNFL